MKITSYVSTLILISTATSLIGCGQAFNYMTPSKDKETPKDSGSNGVMAIPLVSIMSPDAQSFSKGSITLKGQCTDGLPIDITGDVESAMKASCASASYSVTFNLSAGDGMKTVYVTQTGKQGAKSIKNRVFNKDSVAPALLLVTPASNAVVGNSAVIQGTCEQGLNVVLTEAGKAYTLPCASGTFATTFTLLSSDGSVPLSLTQTDAAGNTASLALNLTKDTKAPQVNIGSPAAGSTVSATATLSGSCENGVNVAIAGSGLAAPVNILCASASYSAQIVFTTGAGNKVVDVSQTDAAGNKGSVSRTFSRSAAAGPAIAITQPAENTAFKTTLTVSGTCQTGLTVNFSGAGWASPASTTCTNGAFSSVVTFTSAEGSKTLNATQVNTDGVSGAASRLFVRDTIAPAVTIASPAANTSSQSQVTLMGACENGLTVQVSGAGAAASSQATCSNGAYNTTVNFSSGDGAKAFQVSQTDAASNIGTATRSFVRDTVAPAVKITSPVADTQGDQGLTISGTCEGSFLVTASGSGVQSPATQNCSSGSFSIAILFSANDGAKSVQVSQTDAAGNVGTHSMSYKRVTPVISLDGPALYAQNCAICHGALNASQKIGRSAAQITTAIGTVTQMSSLKGLTSAQISVIAAALAPPTTPTTLAQCDAATDIPSGQLFRLSKTQYANTLNSIFGITNGASYLTDWPSETVTGSFENNGLALDANDVLLTALMIGNEKLVDDVWANATLKAKIMTCTLSTSGCPNTVLKNFLDKAFRRSVETSQVTGFQTVYNEVKATGETDENALKASIQSILLSPSFMYNAYVFGSSLANGHKQLTNMELANRMSYAIWGSAPDATLISKANAGTLNNKAEISAQVKRMLADSRSTHFARSFFDAWMLPTRFVNASSSYFYLTDANLKSSMMKETQTFFDKMIGRDAKMTDLFTSNETFVDQKMATHYGYAGSFNTAFASYNRTEGLGVLNHASIMSLTGRTKAELNVIHRGKWVMDTLLCQGPPPPADPAAVTAIAEDQILQGLTTRQMANFRASNASCTACHTSMDGFGFTFEGLSSLGKSVSATSVDNVGKMPNGSDVTGVSGLKDWLINQDSAKACVAKHLSAYAYGRPLQTADTCVANKIGISSWNLTISDWLTNVIESDGFQEVK